MYYCQELLLPCAVVDLCRGEFSALECHWLTILQKDRADADNGRVAHNLEGFLWIRQAEYWCRAQAALDGLKRLLALWCPQKWSALPCQVAEGSCERLLDRLVDSDTNKEAIDQVTAGGARMGRQRQRPQDRQHQPAAITGV